MSEEELISKMETDPGKPWIYFHSGSGHEKTVLAEGYRAMGNDKD